MLFPLNFTPYMDSTHLCALRGTRRIRMGARSSTEVTQTVVPPFPEPGDAFVAGLSTDFEPTAQLGDGLFPFLPMPR